MRYIAQHASLSFTIPRNLLKPMSIESMMPSNHLILCWPLLLLPSVFPRIRAFSSESALQIRWSKRWRFSFSISSSNEYSGLIPFRIDWFDLPLLSKGFPRVFFSTTVWKHQFFGAQPYLMTTGKTIALIIQTFIGKVKSLLFNMLSRFVIAFPPRSKHLLISWLQSPSTVILEPKKIHTVCHCFHFPPSICHRIGVS